MQETVSIRLPDGKRKQIEAVIKREYPKIKTYSDVMRIALDNYLVTHE